MGIFVNKGAAALSPVDKLRNLISIQAGKRINQAGNYIKSKGEGLTDAAKDSVLNRSIRGSGRKIGQLGNYIDDNPLEAAGLGIAAAGGGYAGYRAIKPKKKKGIFNKK